MTHKWMQTNGGVWWIECVETQKKFQTNVFFFKTTGRCPFCKMKAKDEMKRWKSSREKRFFDLKKSFNKKDFRLDSYVNP